MALEKTVKQFFLMFELRVSLRGIGVSLRGTFTSSVVLSKVGWFRIKNLVVQELVIFQPFIKCYFSSFPLS